MEAAWLSLLRRVGVATALVSQRLTLERRFRESSLDALLGGLRGRSAGSARLSLAVVERDVRRAERLLSHAPRVSDTCLYRALARYAALSRAGFPAVFVMGLPRGGGDAPGHAWVEVAGEPFAETGPVADLAVTFRFPNDEERDATRP